MATRSFEYYKRCCGNERGKRCEIVTASFCGQSDCFATQFQKTFFSKCYNTQIQVRFCTECKEFVEDMGCFTPYKKPNYDLCDHCKVKMKFNPDVATEMFCPKCVMIKENIYFTIPYENKKETTKKYYLYKKTDAFFEGHGFVCDQLLHEQVEVVFNALVDFMHWQENFHPPKHINHRFFLADILDLVLPSEGLAKKGGTFKNEQKE